jgi:outer membrane protein assembly factor BamB
MIAGEICVAVAGYGGPSMGFTLGGKGDITEGRRLWRLERNPQSVGSGVYTGEHLYIPDGSQGTLRCLDPKTGEDIWRERTLGPSFWGSVVMAAGRLYVTNQRGDTVVFAPNSEAYEQLAANSLGEQSNSTPAISDGEIFLRTFTALYCISEK